MFARGNGWATSSLEVAHGSHQNRSMKLLPATILLALAACAGDPPASATRPVQQMRTLEAAPPRPAKLEHPPMLTDEAPPVRPRDPLVAKQLVPLTPADEQLRASLPFTPAIAMDPVDGSKVSIRATTPTLELKGKIYYFSSEENRRLFSSNSDQYTKGVFSRL